MQSHVCVCGVRFVGMADFAPGCPKNLNLPRKQCSCNPGGGPGHVSESEG